ncbi:MAG TPA: Dabb family protein [Acidimicrobiia bacterium]|nr:Dabb family protein [Acidimicrobiia bacterium]
MLRHVVCLTWKDGTPTEAVAAVEAALAALPGRIPQIRAYSYGRDVALAPANAQFAIVADFEDADAWRAYQADEEHQRIVRELIRPHLATRTGVQFELG